MLVAISFGLVVGAYVLGFRSQTESLKWRKQSEIQPPLCSIWRGLQEGCGIQVAPSTQVSVVLTCKPVWGVAEPAVVLSTSGTTNLGNLITGRKIILRI